MAAVFDNGDAEEGGVAAEIPIDEFGGGEGAADAAAADGDEEKGDFDLVVAVDLGERVGHAGAVVGALVCSSSNEGMVGGYLMA